MLTPLSSFSTQIFRIRTSTNACAYCAVSGDDGGGGGGGGGGGDGDV